MQPAQPQITVAGHVCLDVIPTWPGRATARADLLELLTPGRLTEVGPAVLSTGGAVSNTGLALHRLGLPVRLMGKIGDDLLGRCIVELLSRQGAGLADGMIVAPGEPSSYTVVICPPGADRVFLHCPGANNTFAAADVPADRLAGSRLFHFGYPPIMRRMHADGGSELAALLERVRQVGPAVSLDMAHVDPASPAGRVDWADLLGRVLPAVDLFLPSLEETRFMLDRADRSAATGSLLSKLAGRLLDWGAAAVGLKLGDQGLYLRTTGDRGRLAQLGERAALPDPDAWLARELLAPCFAADVAGTTGAGDCTIAGLLAGLIHGLGPEQAMTAAVAVGACCVEQADATSGVPGWSVVQARVESGWERLAVSLPLGDWTWDDRQAIWIGPNDRKAELGTRNSELGAG